MFDTLGGANAHGRTGPAAEPDSPFQRETETPGRPPGFPGSARPPASERSTASGAPADLAVPFRAVPGPHITPPSQRATPPPGSAHHAAGPAEPRNVNPKDRKEMPPPFPTAPGRQEPDPQGGVSPEEYTGPSKQ